MIHSASYTVPVSPQPMVFATGAFTTVASPQIHNGNFSITGNGPKERLQLTHTYDMPGKISTNKSSLSMDVPANMSLDQQTQMGLLWDRLESSEQVQQFHRNAIANNYVLLNISVRYYSSY